MNGYHAVAAATALAAWCALPAMAGSGSGMPEAGAAVKDYLSSFYSAKGSEILSKVNLQIPSGMKYRAELDLKDKIVRSAQDATAQAGGSKVKEIKLGEPRIFDNGTRAAYFYEVSLESGKTLKGRAQAQKLEDGKWTIPLEEEQFPPSREDCLAVFAKNQGRGFITAAEMLGGGSKDEDKSALRINVPGFFAYASDTDYSYLLAYPTSDKRVPQDNRKLWNLSSSDWSRFNSTDYPAQFEKSYALLKAYEAAGYLKLEEGLVKFNYEDAFKTPKIQPATLAGVKIVFTDKGRREILSGDRSYYHGLPTKMLMGRVTPVVNGDISVQKGSKGFMGSKDTFTCPISFSIAAPEGVDPKVVAGYLKADPRDPMPGDTSITLVWNEKENAFEKGF
ncbi:MAG: hypothetical protein ACI4NA_01915 [Succinivibrio sp.]